MNKIIFCSLFIIVLVFAQHTADYDHQDKWQGECTKGRSQSPINIDSSAKPQSTITFNIEIPDKVYKTHPHGQALQNDWIDGSVVTLGGSVNLKYKSLQYHFHTLAEHTFNGVRTDLELHVVHGLADGYKHKLNHLVIGFLFRVLPNDINLQTVFDLVDFTRPSQINLSKVFLPWIKDKNIYNYEGSLTTPTCKQVVNWFVVDHHHWISRKQLEVFQKLINEGKPNFRKLQPINSRTVSVIVRNKRTICKNGICSR